MPHRSEPIAPTRPRLLAAVAVALLLASLAVPMVLARWYLTQDASEHLMIAHAWVQGAGFVNPVQWYFYLDADPPLPGFATRAPLVPMLAAIPLGLGATVTGVGVWHALWAAGVAGALVFVAGRSMRTPAALACGLVVVLSPAWLYLARIPLTEMTTLAAYLLVLSLAAGAHRSVAMACACAAATWLAWLARPNMIALTLAVVVAGVIELGLRRGLRARPVWAYVLSFAGLYLATVVATDLATGFRPYAGYAMMAEMVRFEDIAVYDKQYVGAFAFLSTHLDEALGNVAVRARQVVRFFTVLPFVNFVGWALIPATALALLRRRDGRVEYRLNALSALGFTATTVGTYGGAFEPRYLVLPAVCTSLCAFGLFDEWSRRREPGWSGRAVALVRAAPVVAAILLVLASGALRTAEFAWASWQNYRSDGTRERQAPGDAAVRTLCGSLDPDVIVAAPFPWQFSLWCGSPSLRLPDDLAIDRVRRRFLAEKRPGYLVVRPGPGSAWIEREPTARHVQTVGNLALYAVGDRPQSAWDAPPPLACAGREHACPR